MAGPIQAATKASKTAAKEIAKAASDYVAKNPGANRAEIIDAILNLSKESPDLSTAELITKFEQSVTPPTGAKGQVQQAVERPQFPEPTKELTRTELVPEAGTQIIAAPDFGPSTGGPDIPEQLNLPSGKTVAKGLGVLGAAGTGYAALPGEKAPEIVTPESDEPDDSPALVDKGGALDESPQQNVKALTQGTPKAQGGQESLTNSAQDIINKRTEFRSAIGGRTSVDRTELIDAIKSLDTVEEELKKEAAADPSKIPQLKDIAQARRDALDAYKEKANMNEWLSIADRAINAIGQFAAGRAALGTPYTSTYRPGVTDYGAKTEQAMREMQAETGILEKERGESEQAVSAYERKQEKLADRIRRQRESKVRLLEEDVRRQEREIDKADKFSADLMDNWLQTQRIEAQIKRETEKETKAEAQTQAQQDKAQQSFLQKEIEGLTKILQATNRIETGGVKPQNLSVLATALNTDPESLTEGTVRVGEAGVPVREKKKGFIFDESQSAYLENAVVPAISSQTKDLLDKAKKQLKEIEARRTGQQPAAAPVAAPTPAAAPTRQQPPATGTMIKARVPGYPAVELTPEQFEAAKKEYPNIEIVK